QGGRVRVVVTGMGAVTGSGYGVEPLLDGLFHNRSAVRPNVLFAESDGETSAVSFVADVPPDVPARADHFIRAAVVEAVAQAKLALPLPTLGVFVASIHGNIDAWW